MEAYKDKRLMVAKSIVSAIGENIYELLYHYYRHDRTEVKGTLEWIKNDMKINLEKTNNIKEIMQVEGETWYRFYGEFKNILPEDFVMNKRVKRPPDNPINALISFGNTLLYGKTITAIYNTHLDQRISFYMNHQKEDFHLV